MPFHDITTSFALDNFYNAVGIINIPTPEELGAMIAERTAEQQKEHISA